MATVEQELESFAKFAKEQLAGKDADRSLDDLFDEWRIQHPPPEDILAIRASIRDMENGETGRPFGEFSAEFKNRNDISRENPPKS